jgi:hypothetical protein
VFGHRFLPLIAVGSNDAINLATAWLPTMALTIELRARGVAADLKGSKNEKMEEELRMDVKMKLTRMKRNKTYDMCRIESILTKCGDS